MNNIKKIFLTIILFFLFRPSSFCQLQYLVRLLVKQDKEIVTIVEKSAARNEKVLLNIEDKTTYALLKSFKEENQFNDISLSKKLVDEIVKSYQNGAQVTKEDIKEKLWNDALKDLRQNETSKAESRNRVFKKILGTPTEFIPDGYYISIPSNEKEFKNIFKETNNKQFEECKKVYNSLKFVNDERVKFPNSASNFINAIKEKNEKLVILIGHNDNGLFYFPDGSKINFTEIDGVAKEYNRLVVYLSCNASNYTESPAVSHYLTYSDAVHIAKSIQGGYWQFYNAPQSTVTEWVQTKLDDYAKLYQLKYRLKAVAYITAATGTGFGIYEIKKRE